MKFQNLNLNDERFYLISRGAKSKSSLIAKKFNLHDKYSTHIGIGLFEDQLKIYNITDRRNNIQSALLVENIDSYLHDNVYYCSIWECSNTSQELKKIKSICKDYLSHHITFDINFKLSDNFNLYCSEFCNNVLKKVNPEKFNFKPSSVKLEKFYSGVLKREFLTYYPVDFFQNNKNFQKTHEIFFERIE